MKTLTRHHLIGVNPGTLAMLVFTLLLNLQVIAQSENKNRLSQMINNDRPAVNTIAGYDENIQSQVLQIAQSPDVLQHLGELQKKSMVQFRIIIDSYNQTEQTAFYEMARYPNLISDLVRDGKPTAPEVLNILSCYPADIHQTTIDFGRKYFDVLIRIDWLNNEIDQAFQTYLEPYNTQTRESVKVLLAYPEIVSALVEDNEFTTLLGIVYREDPEWVIRRLDRITQQLALQNKEDVDAYKTQIQNDPEAYNELLRASEKFAHEKNQVRYLEQSYDPVVEVNVINSYPFWFGYPYWYSNPYWRPRPFYYHTGFYRNNFGNVVFVGLPSPLFIHWHTHFYPTLFPHLSYNYYSYYENHYLNRNRNSNRPLLHNSFYKSIEANIINNPRVNNSALAKIDRQRGNTINQANATGSGSARKNNSRIIRQGVTRNPRQGTGTYSATSRREYNTINPRRSEGSVTRQPGRNARSGNVNPYRIRRISSVSYARPQSSPLVEVQRSTEQQSAAPQYRCETPVSTNVTPGREAPQNEKSAAPTRREVPQVNQKTMRNLESQESRAASKESVSRNENVRKNSPAPAVSDESPKIRQGSGRRE